jgi:hypothetical protein
MVQDLIRNLKAGLRVMLFMRHDVVASWGQFGLLFVLSVASAILWNLAATGLPAYFNFWSLPSVVYFLPLVMLASLILAGMGRRMDEVLPLLVAILAADIWLDAFVSVAHLAAGQAPRRAMQWTQWVLFYLGPLWLAACIVVAAARRLDLTWPKRIAAVPIALVLVAVPLLSADFTSALWTRADRDRDIGEGGGRESYDAVASEDVLYLQPSLLEHEVAALLPRQEGRPNLYLVGVAGYGQQNVFRREVEAVDALFAERFGTRGRSIKLINNAATVRDTPIATRVALARALKGVGARMKPDEDVLFLFMTSHGSKDGRFSLSLWPLRLNDLTATDLKAMLDDAGIRNRVIVVSSCYSGGFIDALRDVDSMILTASSKDRNSFGCSNEAEWTYFGKAYFDEALRGTDSFSQAFDSALPIIAEREKKEDHKASEPQRHLGARIEQTLAAWRTGKDNATAAQAVAKPAASDDAYARFAQAWMRPSLAREYAVECRKSSESSSPESFWRRDKDYFGGIGPSSPQWSRIAAAWQGYIDSMCGFLTQDALVGLHQETYRQMMSEKDLAAVSAFMATPEGRKFVQAEQAAGSRLTRDLAEKMRKDGDRASIEYQRAFSDLSKELGQPK